MRRTRSGGGGAAPRPEETGIMKRARMQNELAKEKRVRAAWGLFGAVLSGGWIVLGGLAWILAGAKHVPAGIAIPVAFAFLTEFSFYLLLGFASLRESLAERFSRPVLAASLAGSALLPYAVYAFGTGRSGFPQALCFGVLAAAVAFWFIPRLTSPAMEGARNILFLLLLAAIVLSGVLRWIFPAPMPKLPLEVLGHITLLRTGMLAALLFGPAAATGIGFLPRGRDLAWGAVWFAAAAAAAVPLGWRWKELRLTGHAPGVWQSIGVFLGVFWVLALSEEFFFRGLLQQWLSRWTRSTPAGLILASLLFGSVHLGFRGHFPNWHFGILATILGLCCGAAFLQAGSIRASMITHALAVGAWRLFLT